MGSLTKFNLQEIIDRTNANAFVETGTLHGDGISYALKFPFSEIHSIEIDEELASKCINKFKEYSNVNIHVGNSADILPSILESINHNCIFWLDAHFPGADCGKARYDDEPDYNTRLPLECEITAISKRINQYNDVIICDDAWVYEDGEFEWGTFDSHSARHNHGVTRDSIANGKDSSFIYDLFENTHNIRKLTQDQGYIVLTPK